MPPSMERSPSPFGVTQDREDIRNAPDRPMVGFRGRWTVPPVLLKVRLQAAGVVTEGLLMTS